MNFCHRLLTLSASKIMKPIRKLAANTASEIIRISCITTYPEKTAYATNRNKTEINYNEILAVKYCYNLNNSAKNVKLHLFQLRKVTSNRFQPDAG